MSHEYFSAEKSRDPDSFAFAQSVFEVLVPTQTPTPSVGESKYRTKFLIYKHCQFGSFLL